MNMLLYEFRIPLPLCLSEYQVGQLFSVAEMSLSETGGGEGVEVVKNEPYENVSLGLPGYSNGMYTYKIYHMESRVPGFVRLLIDPGRLDVHEEAWNAFPFCKTVITNPGFMKKNFSIVIESIHVENDAGHLENALRLTPEELEMRKVIHIDIGNDPFTGRQDMAADPSRCKSEKTRRGPLHGDWIASSKPIMTAYKVVRAEFKWFGLQKKVEQWIQVNEQRLFTHFHRQMFCWMDRWYGMTMKDIRNMENEVMGNLKVKINKGELKVEAYGPSGLYDGKSTYAMK